MIYFTNRQPPCRKFINNNKIEICYVLGVFFCILLFLLFAQYNVLSTLDAKFIYIALTNYVAILYNCFIDWNGDMVMYLHYLFVIMIYVVLLSSSNMWLLGYYLALVVAIIIGWYIKNKCIFDKLCWDIDFFGYKYTNTDECSHFMVYILLILYPLKMLYSNYNE